jgi:hypothetical protein
MEMIMQGAPLSIVIIEVVRHTPAYVWGILAALVFFGSWQMRDQSIVRTRVLLLPIALSAYSLWGATSTFGLRPEVIAAWAVGIAAMLWAALWVQWPRRVEFQPERDTFFVGGSVVPLLAMLGVFAVRYVATVALIMHPQWRSIEAVSIAGGLGYGLLSGVFAMRARTILASAGSRMRLLPA